MFLTLEPILEERRRPEAELRAAFNHERARILGVLLDAMVEGLKRLPDTYLPKLPRMADFALWANRASDRGAGAPYSTCCAPITWRGAPPAANARKQDFALVAYNFRQVTATSANQWELYD